MKYRRYYQSGGTYFFTVNTFDRKGLFWDIEARKLFMQSVTYVQTNHPFVIHAYCIMPNHIHMIWELPEGDCDYPTRWRLAKSHFSRHWLVADEKLTETRKRKKERAIWQRRYWEHYIRDAKDYRNHVDYIHYNAVKHGYVKAPKEWEGSSFKDYVKDGIYSEDWGTSEVMKFIGVDFGE